MGSCISLQADIVKPIGDASSFLINEVKSIIHLQKNVYSLRDEMERLRKLKEDVENEVNRVESADPRMKRRAEVGHWIENVRKLDAEVDSLVALFLQNHRGSGCLKGCSTCWPRRKLHKKVLEMQSNVNVQIERLKSFQGNLVSKLAPPKAEEIPLPFSTIVGQEGSLSQVQKHLCSDELAILGIYGMGGVGKTALLRKLNKEFITSKTNDFGLVIWVTVSSNLDILTIQKAIAERLDINSMNWTSEQLESQAKSLYKALRKRKFLVMLDDVWQGFDLSSIGLPPPGGENKYKVVITTRSKDVCKALNVEALMKIEPLGWKDSCDLFCKNVGTELLSSNNPIIKELVEIVIGKCGGLPLALITVGRAMRDAKEVWEWEDAVDALNKQPDVEEKVLKLLKFSYDKLEDEVAKQCLLYCCLFPEDDDIVVDRLIDYLVGEGIIDSTSFGGIQRAHNRGLGVVKRLKSVCLLEDVSKDGYVRLHDMVREMCLWLTSDKFDPTNICLVDANKGLTRVPRVEQWGRAKRVSLMRNRITQLPDLSSSLSSTGTGGAEMSSDGLVLSALIMHNNPVELLPSRGFFPFMAASLCVLDLSHTHIEWLPEEIGLLVALRYLGLRGSGIRSLPRELGKLVNLRHLDVAFTRSLVRIPNVAVTRLTRLQSLNSLDSGYRWALAAPRTSSHDHHLFTTCSGGGDGETEEAAAAAAAAAADVTFQDVLHLYLTNHELLEDFRVSLKTSASFEEWMSTGLLARHCTTHLSLKNLGGAVALVNLQGIRHLEVSESDEVQELRLGDSSSHNSSFQRLEHLWLDRLGQGKIVVGVDEQPRIMAGGGRPPPPPALSFQRLRYLEITDCHGLTDITWAARLPCLDRVELDGCGGIEAVVSTHDSLQIHQPQGHPHLELEDPSSFPSLRYLRLVDLPSLRSICSRPLLFPSLVQLTVQHCHAVTKLPWGPNSCPKIQRIEGSKTWWNALEWDDHGGVDGLTVKSLFQHKLSFA